MKNLSDYGRIYLKTELTSVEVQLMFKIHKDEK